MPTSAGPAMPVIASLTRAGGIVVLSPRHGPVPPGRRMFDVSAVETIGLAGTERLRPVLDCHDPSRQDFNRRNGINWTRLVFKMDERSTL